MKRTFINVAGVVVWATMAHFSGHLVVPSVRVAQFVPDCRLFRIDFFRHLTERLSKRPLTGPTNRVTANNFKDQLANCRPLLHILKRCFYQDFFFIKFLDFSFVPSSRFRNSSNTAQDFPLLFFFYFFFRI